MGMDAETAPDTVEAYTASWIEIMMEKFFLFKCQVEAYTASWIEI